MILFSFSFFGFLWVPSDFISNDIKLFFYNFFTGSYIRQDNKSEVQLVLKNC